MKEVKQETSQIFREILEDVLIDCSISENFTAKSDPYTLIQNGAPSIVDRLSKQSPEDVKSFCETQQQKGFAKGIDCQTISVKGN